MKIKLLVALLASSLWCGWAQAQIGDITNPLNGRITVVDAGTCSTANSFVIQQLPQNASTTTVNLSGTFTATLTARLSNNGGATWTTGGAVAAGTTSFSTNGFTHICVDTTAFTSGTVLVTISTGLLQVQSVVAGGSSSSSPAGIVLPSAFGAKGGVLRSNGFDVGVTLTITSGSNAITSSSFSPTNATLQVGWTCFATNWSGLDSGYIGSDVILPQTTVASVSGTGAFTTVANATGSTSGTNGVLFCGAQDDTTALNAAGTAALGNKTACKQIQLSDVYFFSGGLWNTTPLCPSSGTGPSHYGSVTGLPNRGGTPTLVPLPNFTYTGAGGCLGGSGSTCIAGWRGESLFNFAVDGGGQRVGGSHSVQIVTEQIDGQYENLMMNGWLTTSNGSSGIGYNAGVQGSKNITVDGGGNTNCIFGGFWNIAYDIFCGNGNATPLLFNAGSFGTIYGGGYQNSGGSSILFDVSGQLLLVGGGIVMNSNASNCWVVRTGGDLTLDGIGCVNTGNTGSAAIATLGTGKVHLRDTTTLQGGSAATTVNLASTSTILHEGGALYAATPATGVKPTMTTTGTGTVPCVPTFGTFDFNENWTFTCTAAAGAVAAGTFTLNFAGTFQQNGNAPACSLMLKNGTGTWNARASVIEGTTSTTSYTWNWDNNAVNLAAGSTFSGTGTCLAR